MKAITLTQPWASLVACGAKKIETRSWSTSYRGPIAIHAAKVFPRWAKDVLLDPTYQFYREGLGFPDPDEVYEDFDQWTNLIGKFIAGLPTGCVIATANLYDCLPTANLYDYLPTELLCSGVLINGTRFSIDSIEREFGDYSEGRFGFLLRDVVRIEPVPARGALSLWEWDGQRGESRITTI